MRGRFCGDLASPFVAVVPPAITPGRSGWLHDVDVLRKVAQAIEALDLVKIEIITPRLAPVCHGSSLPL